MKKQTVSFFFAWALALIAFVSVNQISAFAAAQVPAKGYYEFEITVAKTKSTAYVWGQQHVPLLSVGIKNVSNVPVKLEAVDLDSSWTIDNLFIEEDDHLVLANTYLKGGGVSVPISVTIAPGGTFNLNIRGSIIPKNDRDTDPMTGEVWATFQSLEYEGMEQGIGAAFSYPNWSRPVYAIVDSVQPLVTMSNTSGLYRLENASVHSFTVNGDPNMKSRVLFRVSGPALADFGVKDFLKDPVIQVLQRNQVVGGSDDWSSGLADSFSRVGAFPFKAGSYDSAVELDLLPGAYTVQVKAWNQTSGTYMFETYQETNIISAAKVVVRSSNQPNEKG